MKPWPASRFCLTLFGLLVLGFSLLGASVSRSQARPALVGKGCPTREGEARSQLDLDITSRGHIFVPVRIGDSRVLSFILDSAASTSVVSARVAKELELETGAVGTLTGSGERSETVDVIQHVILKLGGIEFSRENVAAIPFESLERSFGRPIDGIVGYDFISKFVVEVDYVGRIAKLYDPSSFKYSGAGRRFPVTLVEGQPLLQLAVAMPDGRNVTGLFHVDSGATTAVEFFRPFVESQNLLPALARRVQVNTAGVGGDSSTVYGRIDSMTLGEYKVDGPIAGFSQARVGSTTSNAAAGLIGGKFFRRFRVIFDQPHGSMIFEPNANFRPAPDAYDTVGVRLVAGGADYRTFTVAQVLPQTPAEEFGLRPGDSILSIDGKLTASIRLDDLREIFMREDRTLSVEVERAGKHFQLKVKTRRLL